MKKILLVAALIVSLHMVFTVQVFAQATTKSADDGLSYSLTPSKPTADDKPDIKTVDLITFSFDFSSRYYSKYVSPFDKLVYDKPVIQSELTIWMKAKNVPGAFYIDV